MNCYEPTHVFVKSEIYHMYCGITRNHTLLVRMHYKTPEKKPLEYSK